MFAIVFRAPSTLITSALVAGLLALSGPTLGAPIPLKYKVRKRFSAIYAKTGPNPLKWKINGTDGLAWDGSGLWITACDTPVFAKLDTDGELLDEFTLPGKEIADHLAWDGEYLWADVHHIHGTLIRIDTAKRTVIKTIPLPFEDIDKMVPMGLGYDGTWLWTSDPGGNALYRIDPETGAGADKPFGVLPKVGGVSVGPCGIVSDEQSCLWMGDLGRGVFFQVHSESGEIVSYLSPPNNPDPYKYGKFRPEQVKKLFTGMTMSSDGRVWVVDELEGNPLIYELEVNFPKTGPCAHPVGVGETCVEGGQPFCRAASPCWGPGGGAATCRARCDRAEQDCADGSACWTVAGVGDICRPEATDGYAGDPCSTDSDCATAHCFKQADGGKCIEPCPGGGLDCYREPETPDADPRAGTGGAASPPPGQEAGGCRATAGTGIGGAPRPMALLGLFALSALSALSLRRSSGYPG